MKLVSSRGVGLLLAIPVLLLAGAVYATANVQRNAALKSAREQVASQRLLTAMLDQETGARGFFQTRQQEFLQPLTQGTRAFGSSLVELRSLLAGDSGLQQMLADQEQRAAAWHTATQAAVLALEHGGRVQSDAVARRAKSVMDGFRGVHTAFDASLNQRRSRSLSAATGIAVAVAIALAALLAAGGLLLTRRMARNEEARQHDQSELRELLQASESEQESRGLLIRHVEKLIRGAGAAVLNRNNSADRLEITHGDCESPLRYANTEQMRPRSCMAVRLSRSYDQQSDGDGLQQCEICGGLDGAATCEPLLVGGQVIGSVLVASRKPIDADRRIRLRESVAQAAPILANQRNLAIAEGRAASDALTGLPNRRAADEAFKRMAAHAGRSITPLAAIMLDLDHFKLLNDRHGHESGDRALALVGSIIGSTIRASDFAARYGGEEFLVLLPDTDRDSAMILAEKLRSEIEHAELVGIGAITASLGVAVLPMDAAEPDELLRKADRALYAAKENGRNRVHSASPSAAEVEIEL
ncbi:MAG: diguanylate cyclase [Solirubrobacterales bacterium]|nr:diguanylate cyclase [Solirubrobacterales bacterium]